MVVKEILVEAVESRNEENVLEELKKEESWSFEDDQDRWPRERAKA